MMVSTKGRYALRLMIDLAQNCEKGNVSLKDVSVRQEISVKYLEQIVAVLAKEHLLISSRGAKGGYRLAKEAREYSVGEILRVTEGSLSPVACLETEYNDCPRQGECLTLGFWEGLSKVINTYIDNVSLEDLIQQSKKEDYSI